MVSAQMEATNRLLDNDPYQAIEKLGSGGSGEVWKVSRRGNPNSVFARKQFSVAHENDPKRFEEIENEIRILKRLNHFHIIAFVQSYQMNGNHGSINYYIVLFPVADMSLHGLFEWMGQPSVDKPLRSKICRAMCEWPTCLLRALDYVHSMNVRHKDIKPQNILLKNYKVYLTDFGISKDFRNLTSKTEGTLGVISQRYIAPEMDREDRRGRSTDIWALGCVLIELCTVASSENSISDLDDHLRAQRNSRRPPPFCDVPYSVFRWIWRLSVFPGPDIQIGNYIQKLLQMVFLMVDPNPDRRITSRQLIDLISDRNHDYFHLIKDYGCAQCRQDIGVPAADIPLHSTFKTRNDGSVFHPPTDNLSENMPDLWEVVKHRWLRSHIWWDDFE